jgi:hypothetical protein
MPRSPSRRLLASALAVVLLLAPALALGPPPLCDPPGDGITRALTAAYTHGVSTTVSATGIGALAGSPTPTKPVRFTLAKAAAVTNGMITVPAQSAVYRAVGFTADTLTGVTFESGTDQDFAAGDWIGFASSAQYTRDINARLRIIARAYVSVLDAGTVVGDGVTDDGPAIQAVLDANPSRAVYFPRTATAPGGVSYYKTTPLVVTTVGQALVGETSGYTDGTIIRSAPGVVGIDIRHTATRAEVRDLVLIGQETYQQVYPYEGVMPAGFTTPRAPIANIVRAGNVCTLTFVSTYGVAFTVGIPVTVRQASNSGFNGTFTPTAVTPTTVTYPQTAADATSVSGFVGGANWDLADATAPTSDGVRVGAQITRLTNVAAKGFGRHGFNYSNADVDGGAGLSDDCTTIDCYAANCRGYGFYVAGGDSNASLFVHCQASTNALGGVFENSFLGNTWVSPKTDENHVDNATIQGIYTRPTQALASLARASNVVTLTFSAAYTGADPAGSGFVPGQGITVSVPADTSFDGTFVVVSVSGATVTYAQAGANATPSIASATGRRARMQDSWLSAGIPPTGGAYRTSLSNANRSTWINPYSEGGQSQDGTGPSSIFGTGSTITNSIGLSVDFSAGGRPGVFALLSGIGQQGFDGGFPSVLASFDSGATSQEWVGLTSDQDSIRYRKRFDGSAYLWTHTEGPNAIRLYKSDPASDPGAVLVMDVDRASCNIAFGKAVATGSGATGARPTVTAVGSMWYDTTLHLPIWWSGSDWRDAAGTVR